MPGIGEDADLAGHEDMLASDLPRVKAGEATSLATA